MEIITVGRCHKTDYCLHEYTAYNNIYMYMVYLMYFVNT